MTTQINCPDRTAQYLLSLQSKYRDDPLPIQKLIAGQYNIIAHSNPFRVFLTFSIRATATVDIYFVNGSGQLVWYAETATNINVTVNQQQQFILPTYQWVCFPTNSDTIAGSSFVKQ